MKITVAQNRYIAGDLQGNAQKILAAARLAAETNSHIVLTPEMALTGYPLDDLLGDADFGDKVEETLHHVIDNLPEHVTCFIGTPTKTFPQSTVDAVPREWYNSVVVASKGVIHATVHKTLLPTYGVFEDSRWFVPNSNPGESNIVTFPIFNTKGEGRQVTAGVLICEDIWNTKLATLIAKTAREANSSFIYVANASPYEENKHSARLTHVEHLTKVADLPVVYVNMTGGQDTVVYDGGSHIMLPPRAVKGGVSCATLPFFQVETATLDLNDVDSFTPVAATAPSTEEVNALTWRALTVALKDYVETSGLRGVVVGLSGGLDSAVAAALAVDALGAEKILGVLMPGPYSSVSSVEDAEHLAVNLGITTVTLPISDLYRGEVDMLTAAGLLDESSASNVAKENVQARLRALHLMTLANSQNCLVLNTGNKSETSVGYFTLGGDSSGGFAVLQDVYKTRVYELGWWRNSVSEVIPVSTLVKPPSAELAPDQEDTDSLPPYPVLDAILVGYLEEGKSVSGLCETVAQIPGFSAAGDGELEQAPALVSKVVNMVLSAEHKRRQVAFGPKITRKAYSKDRRYPVVNGWRVGRV